MYIGGHRRKRIRQLKTNFGLDAERYCITLQFSSGRGRELGNAVCQLAYQQRLDKMTLTEEQRKRMEENRIRALQIKRTRELEKSQRERNSSIPTATVGSSSNGFHDGGFVTTAPDIGAQERRSRMKNISSEHSITKTRSVDGGDFANITNGEVNEKHMDDGDNNDDESSLEEFEHNATPYITQTEAQKSYCLPLGTLAVCTYIEKDNPHKRGWSKMKLYARQEVRRRARQRFGGKAGLIRERDSRKRKRLEKDLEEIKDVFGSR